MQHSSENADCLLKETYDSCVGPPAYEHEGAQYCILHLPIEEKADDFKEALEAKLKRGDFNFRGAFFPGDVALFANSAFGALADFFRATFSGAVDFRRVTFREASFTGAIFGGPADFRGAAFAKASFTGATFNEAADFSGSTFSERAYFRGTTFSEPSYFKKVSFSESADFIGATFDEATDFREATFSERVSFSKATFSEAANFFEATFSGLASFYIAAFSKVANFCQATFSGVTDFKGATFSEAARFSEATFSEAVDFFEATFSTVADFSRATFKERAAFSSLEMFPLTVLDFRTATIEKPEWMSFHAVCLRPSWFIDVDAQKFDFSDVEWFRLPGDVARREGGKELRLEDEIEALESRGVDSPLVLPKLTKTCKRLMNNAEESRDYLTANKFHYWSMETLRKVGFSRLGVVATLYWALSGYGDRPRRAFSVLVAMWIVFAVLYFLLADSSPFWVFSASDVGQGMDFARQAAVYSLGSLARLNPKPEPEGPGWFQTLVIMEGLLGPLQIALFLLAVRRKVMR